MKNGYKKTSLGILPNEWEVVQLEEICEINQGLQIAISKRYTVNAENRYFYITNEFLKETCKTKYYIENPPKSVICCKDDILMTRTGNTGQVVTNINGVFHNNFFKIKYNKKTIDKKYFLYILSANKMQHKILTKAGGSTILDLKHSDFYSLKIPLPPLNEQRKIAEILNTYDEAILLTSNLISAKKEFKKALMQNLLTAKIRFPNFKDRWKEVKLGDIGEFKTSSVDKIINSNEKIVSLINYMDVYKNTHISKKLNLSKTSATEQEINKFYIQKGDILFTPSSETPDDIGHSAVIIDDFDCALYSYHLIRFRTFNKFDICFLGYIFNNEKILKQFTRLSQGTTRYTLSIKDFQNIKIKLPNLSEQSKIAEILSSVDEEINLLNKKLEQLNLQKRGVMQNLLSGKVRVK